MKHVGIICEYNPLHTGHAYLLERVRGAQTVICLMSGNFTQRGEAAILPPVVRAAMAVCPFPLRRARLVALPRAVLRHWRRWAWIRWPLGARVAISPPFSVPPSAPMLPLRYAMPHCRPRWGMPPRIFRPLARHFPLTTFWRWSTRVPHAVIPWGCSRCAARVRITERKG